MTRKPTGVGPGLEKAREVTIDALCEHFANDAMDIEEFERRVDQAHKAASSEELKVLLRDLPGGDLPAARNSAAAGPGASAVADTRGRTLPARADEVTGAPPSRVRDHGLVLAMFSGAARRGAWVPAHTNYALAVCGGVELDFRQARLAAGVTEVRIMAVWGGVKIIVPPGLRVESRGVALMGGFEHADDPAFDPDPDSPVLLIRGIACMGGVHIDVRLPGESARDARRRRRLQRKERKRLGGGLYE